MGNNYIRNRSGSGTVAYQAPEVFVEGSKLTPAVDVYSFGIMMYELYCCRRLPFGRTLDTPRIPLPRGKAGVGLDLAAATRSLGTACL